MPKVAKCMCQECHYNEKFECTAENILVESVGNKSVESSEGTCCRTFRPK